MDLAKLNSATKYPSILTYHEMGDRGRLNPKVQVPFVEGMELFISEKVDGTNARIILPPESNRIVHGGLYRKYLIGSREELLTADQDLVFAPDYGIVEALRPIADALPAGEGLIQVFFFEVFGGNLPASKQYSDVKQISVRLFDEASILVETLEMPIEKIAAWRDAGGQMFKPHDTLNELLQRIKEKHGLSLARVPDLGRVTSLPTSIEETYEWLKQHSKSGCDLGGGKSQAEGVVVRTWDRKLIAKLRFEDYERTLGIKRKQ